MKEHAKSRAARGLRHSFRARWIGRYDPHGRVLRIARLVWQRGVVGDGDGYSTKLTVALRPSLFSFRGQRDDWCLTLAGLRLHLRRAYGGFHV